MTFDDRHRGDAPRIPVDRRRAIWAAVIAAVLIAGGLLYWSGATPWILLAGAAGASVVLVAQRASWFFALGATPILFLTGAVLCSRVSPFIGLSLADSTGICLAIIGLAAVAFVVLRPEVRLPELRPTGLVLPALLVPVAALILIAVQGFRGALGYSWAMHDDAVWNVVTARWLIEDRGVVTSLHSNPSPMTPLTIALAMASGRHEPLLLLHDVSRAGELWIVLAATSSALAGFIALRVIPGSRSRILSALGALAAAAVPLAWSAFGYALEFGFYNATISLVLLFACWLCWLELPRSSELGMGALAVAAVGLLANWGPLAVIPAALFALEFVKLLRSRRTKRSFIVACASALAVLAYLLLFTLPDLLSQSSAFTADGNIFPATPLQVLAIIIVSLLAIVGCAIAVRSVRTLLGVGSVVVGSSVALTYLILQRRNESPWGYYPIKFTWLLSSVLLTIAIGVVFGLAARIARWLVVPALLAACGLLAGVAWQMGPRYLPVKANVFPLVNIAMGTSGVAHLDPAANVLLHLPSHTRTTIAVQLVSSEYDRFMNSWLLQLPAKSAQDPVRTGAYYLDPENTEDVCTELTRATGLVTVFTSRRSLAHELASCTGPSFVVRVIG